MPVAMALAGVSAADAGRGIQDTKARSVLLAIHAGAALAGVALFVLAAALAAMFLYQDRALKKHRLSRMMPPVRQLEQMAYTIVGIGFICLTISLALGVYLASRWGQNWARQPSVLLSAVLWGVFAVLFHVRLARAWLGRKVAYFTLAGFALAVVLVVLMLSGDTLHWFLK